MCQNPTRKIVSGFFAKIPPSFLYLFFLETTTGSGGPIWLLTRVNYQPSFWDFIVSRLKKLFAFGLYWDRPEPRRALPCPGLRSFASVDEQERGPCCDPILSPGCLGLYLYVDKYSPKQPRLKIGSQQGTLLRLSTERGKTGLQFGAR